MATSTHFIELLSMWILDYSKAIYIQRRQFKFCPCRLHNIIFAPRQDQPAHADEMLRYFRKFRLQYY